MDHELRETLEQGVSLVSQTINTADNIVAMLRDGQGNAVLIPLTGFIDEIHSLLVVVESARTKGIVLQIDKINTQVAEMLDAVTNRDYNLLADVIDYDLMVQLSEWKETFVKASE